MEDIQIHIWEFAEKTDSVNKDEDVIMVHDNISLKKIHIGKLFDYLRQDQKINNTIAYFENRFNQLEKKYDVYYSSIEISLAVHEETVEKLIEKFENDKSDIRLIETNLGNLSNNLTEIKTDFKNIRNERNILSDTLESFSNIISSLRLSTDLDKITLTNINSRLYNVKTRCSLLNNNIDALSEQIENIKHIITDQNDDKKDEIIDIIESKYNKVLSILDYYHHIHE